MNWLMAFVIHVWISLAPQRDHHPHQGAQVGASQVVVVQAACLSSSCCHFHCMHLFKRHKYLLLIDQFIVDIYTELIYFKFELI